MFKQTILLNILLILSLAQY